MNTTLRTSRLGGLEWWQLRGGSREDVFATLGRAARDSVRAVIGQMPERPALHRFARSAGGEELIARVTTASSRQFPREWSELAAMADGAGVDHRDLVLANLRGDLGGYDGTGCSDVAWRGTPSLLGHNEDGAPGLHGHFRWLTLEIDGDVPVTVQWYPGFVPANAFAMTGNHLVWGINHIQAVPAADAPGRHFVARALQQQPGLDAAVEFLRTTPSAGGFTYNIGHVGSGRIVTVETGYGRAASCECEAERASWHTNHLRFLDLAGANTEAGGDVTTPVGAQHLGQAEESVTRGRALDRLTRWTAAPSAADLLGVLAAQPFSHGVFRDAVGDDPLMTLCSTVVDLDGGVVTIQPRDGDRVSVPVADLLGANG